MFHRCLEPPKRLHQSILTRNSRGTFSLISFTLGEAHGPLHGTSCPDRPVGPLPPMRFPPPRLPARSEFGPNDFIRSSCPTGHFGALQCSAGGRSIGDLRRRVHRQRPRLGYSPHARRAAQGHAAPSELGRRGCLVDPRRRAPFLPAEVGPDEGQGPNPRGTLPVAHQGSPALPAVDGAQTLVRRIHRRTCCRRFRCPMERSSCPLPT